MDLFLHVNEMIGGWQAFCYSALFSNRTTLWAPSLKSLDAQHQKGLTPISAEGLIELIEEGLVQIAGREDWLNSPAWRKSQYPEREDLQWLSGPDNYISVMANEDKLKPRHMRRVVVAAPGKGGIWAEEQVATRSEKYMLARTLVENGQVPQNFNANATQLKTESLDEKIKLLLSIFRNHEDARQLTRSDLSCEDEGFPFKEYGEIVERKPYGWSEHHPYSEKRISNFIEIATELGPIESISSFREIARNREFKKEISYLLYQDVNLAQRLWSEVQSGTSDASAIAPLIYSDPTNQVIGGVVTAACLYAQRSATPRLNRRKFLIGACAATIGPAAIAGNELLKMNSVTSAGDRYTGPRWPFLLMANTKDPTIEQINLLSGTLLKISNR